MVFHQINALLPIVLTAQLVLSGAYHANADPMRLTPARCDAEKRLGARHPHAGYPLISATYPLEVAVEFEADSTDLKPEARRTLDRFASLMTAHLAKGGQIHIVGQAMKRCSGEMQDLSVQHALAVTSYLEAAWRVPTERMKHCVRGPDQATVRYISTTDENQSVTLRLVTGLARCTDARLELGLPISNKLDLDDFSGARNPFSVSGCNPRSSKQNTE